MQFHQTQSVDSTRLFVISLNSEVQRNKGVRRPVEQSGRKTVVLRKKRPLKIRLGQYLYL